MLLKHAGMEPIRMELIPKDMKFDTKDGLVSWVRTTCLPFTSIVPEEKRDAFIEGIVEQYLSKNPADIDGTIHIKSVRLEIEAIKPVLNDLI